MNNEADAEAGENGAVSTLEKLGTEADPPNESTPTSNSKLGVFSMVVRLSINT